MSCAGGGKLASFRKIDPPVGRGSAPNWLRFAEMPIGAGAARAPTAQPGEGNWLRFAELA
jgi:hypothetical protein